MTSTEPMTYKPGPELDAVVAEKVFGRLITWNRAFQYLNDEERKTDNRSFVSIPEYSITWEGMRLVVEEMQRRGYSVFINNHSRDFKWHCNIRGELPDILGAAFGDIAPFTVCLAAISAIEGQGEGVDNETI